MNRGLYAAYLGMRARQRALDVTANNIANASTAGFKADRLLYRSIEAAEVADARRSGQANGVVAAGQPATTTSLVPQPPAINPNANVFADGADDPTAATAGNRALGVLANGITQHSVGPINTTNRPLDVALSGDGFLVVQTPRGERYTRAGALTVDASGQLTTPDGDLVLGQNGAITLPQGEVTVGADGQISVTSRDGQAAAAAQTPERLRLVRFANPREALVKEGRALFAPTGTEQPLEAPNTRVIGGALEMSNANAIEEMAAMIQHGREFDSLQRSVTLMMNDIGRRVANELGQL